MLCTRQPPHIDVHDACRPLGEGLPWCVVAWEAGSTLDFEACVKRFLNRCIIVGFFGVCVDP